MRESLRSRGLSPLTRGNRQESVLRAHGRGPIPAHAGEPLGRLLRRCLCRAYPRSRGGTTDGGNDLDMSEGLSPLTRGNHQVLQHFLRALGPIPAHAGEPSSRSTRRISTWAYPRSRGGTYPFRGAHAKHWGLSPLTRGNPHVPGARPGRGGPIPAHAGEPCVVDAHGGGDGAYPRSRGGTRRGGLSPCAFAGLSPLTRGNRRASELRNMAAGPIPAHAGEPSSVNTSGK